MFLEPSKGYQDNPGLLVSRGELSETSFLLERRRGTIQATAGVQVHVWLLIPPYNYSDSTTVTL